MDDSDKVLVQLANEAVLFMKDIALPLQGSGTNAEEGQRPGDRPLERGPLDRERNLAHQAT